MAPRTTSPRLTPNTQIEDGSIRSPKRRRLNSHLTRGPTACERCRQRKTKCDNSRPQCGFCAKSDASCVYLEDVVPAPWEDMGERILDAIDQLATVVKGGYHSKPYKLSQSQYSLIEPSSRYTTQSPAQSDPQAHFTSPTSAPRHSGNEDDVNELVSLDARGTDAVLAWPIFENLQSSQCLYAEEPIIHSATTNMPDMSRETVQDLTTKYIEGVHIKNPILDIVELNRMTLEIAENGIDWSAESCLIALVCAIGAISEGCCDPQAAAVRRRLSEHSDSSFESDPQVQLSMQFWSIAAKRLGSIMVRSDIISIQCLCLAGIFYMHQLQPLAAWKFFNLAGASWYTLQTATKKDLLAATYTNHSDSFTVMQSLFFTIWKSECELRVELDVPGPVLKSVDFPHAFPSPPIQDVMSPPQEVEQHEKTWYYYLAEIAARHLQNQIIRGTASFTTTCTNANVQSMLARVDLLETLLQEWYDSLPQAIRFIIPSGYVSAPPANDFCQILLHRYLFSRDLLTRSFLRLCIETDLDISQHLRSRVVAFASENVRFSILKASQHLGHLHQGTWFSLRNIATSTLILSAVSRAQNSMTASFARQIVLPADWRERITGAVSILSPFWKTQRGGASRLHELIQQCLDMSI